MPNWCFSQVNISDSREHIATIKDELSKAFASNPVGADFGNQWLGNLLLHIGMDKETVIHGDLDCRGSVSYIFEGDDYIELEMESAWQPHLKCIQKFVETHSDTARFKYYADEPGCELFWTNDPVYAGTVYTDVWLNDPKENMFYTGLSDNTKETAYRALKEHLGEGSWDELCAKAANVEGDDEYVNIYVYEYVDLDDEAMR